MRKLIGMVALALSASSVSALETRTICIFDPVGTSGPMYKMMEDYKQFAVGEGIEIKLHAYTDEKIASDDFKAGQCDGVVLTGARARPFSKFASTIEAIGAVPDDKVMRNVVTLISSEKGAKYMKNDRYEVGGVLPAGAVYLFVDDRNIDTVEEMSGKKIATLDYDQPSIKMVNHVGAAVVPSNSANFSGKFNNGSVDIAYAPALAYKPLEMYKGLGTQGGILRYNLAYLDFQLVMHADRFPEGYGQKSRQYVASMFDRMLKQIEDNTAEIDDKYWIDLPEAVKKRYDAMLRAVRVELRNEGVYDGTMLKLLKGLRCKEDPAAAECAENLE